MWTYGAERAEYDRYGEVIARQRKDIDQMQAELDSSRSYQTTLTDTIEQTRLRLDALKQQINGTPAYKQIEYAEAEKDARPPSAGRAISRRSRSLMRSTRCVKRR